MTEIKGLPGAPGCAAGNAVIFWGKALSYERVDVSDPAAESAALQEARERYDEYLGVLAAQAGAVHGDEGWSILEVYREIVRDDVFFGGVAELIDAERVCASWAIERKRSETEALFCAVDDEYLKARMTDINNVCAELTAELQGVSAADLFAGAEGDCLVVFAPDLSPADTVRLDRTRLGGIVTERGGVTSHTVILAKALGIPAVVGAGDLLDSVRPGGEVLLDGAAGSVLLDAGEAERAAFLKRKEYADRQKTLFSVCEDKRAVTLDGAVVRVNVNSGDRDSIEGFDPARCDGVGLFRTEFLYMGQSDYPSEEYQFRVYRDMARRAAGKELIIRTLDIGGDKQLDYMSLPREPNPFLGWRAIRLCLGRPDVFKVQLRAILRAAFFGDVKIMFPMVVNLEELLRAKALLEEAKAELAARGVPYRADIPVGIMVETPAAVFLADQLARHVSFFSIGSNDLIQYTTATDRQNERVQYLYDSCNISFLRAVKLTCDSARAGGVTVGICGETASEPRLIPLWVAIGVDELSVAPALVGRTKYVVGRCSRAALQPLMHEVLSTGSVELVSERLGAVQRSMGL